MLGSAEEGSFKVMPEYRLRLELSRTGRDHPLNVVEETALSDDEKTPEGEEALGIELAAEFRRAIRFHEYFTTIPNTTVDLVDSLPRTFRPDQWFDAQNTQGLWLEIYNTLADVRFLLAQSRAYKSLEPPEDKTDDPSNQLRYYAHFSKLYHLNLAVLGIVKIQDLVVRLLFENFGGPSLIEVDQTDDDWEKKLTLKAAKIGLKQQLDLGRLSQSEYDDILAALSRPSASKFREKVVSYRNGIVHRLRPSVDYPQLFTPLEDRVGQPFFDASGVEKGRQFSLGGLPTTPQYFFTDLYAALLDYLKHVIEMLTLLKTIPRLA
jgi:hypothetical protein